MIFSKINCTNVNTNIIRSAPIKNGATFQVNSKKVHKRHGLASSLYQFSMQGTMFDSEIVGPVRILT